MSFFRQEQNIDFGSTFVDNIFIDDYMPLAKGEYVKIYLTGYKYSFEAHGSYDNDTIAKVLNISVESVRNAWDFWEELGIVIKHPIDKHNYNLEFVNLKQLYVDNIYLHIASGNPISTDSLSENERTKETDIKKMFFEIEQMFGRFLNINEKNKVLKWNKNYNISPELLIKAFEYSVTAKNIKNFSYIESIISGWFDNNIETIEDYEDFQNSKSRNYTIYNLVKQHLGFTNRQLTKKEKELIDKWTDLWNFSSDEIILALDNSSKISNPNLNYFDSILENWYKEGISERKKNPQVSKKSVQSSNSFHNFDQKYSKLNEKELENIFRKNISKKGDNDE